MRKINLKSILIVIGLISVITSCKTSDLVIDAPKCIESKIEEIMNHETTNPPTQVRKWEVDGEIYYYITADCCDQYNYLYDNNCELICAPDGGITGNGDGNCLEFTSEIVKTLIWQDQRI